MPAFGNLVINDGAGTPLAHTFSPTSRSPDGVCVWHDRSVANAIGQHYVVHKHKAPGPVQRGGEASDSQRNYAIDWHFTWITLESTSAATGTGIPPAPTVAYINRMNVTGKFPERGTSQERKHVRMFTVNGLQHATVVDTIENLTTITG
jgi:hypothetical protein